MSELKAEIVQSTAIYKDEEAKHVSIKADIYDRLHDIITRVDPERARRAIEDLIEQDNDLLLSYIADPFLIRAPILSILNKIKKTENKAKLAPNNTGTLPQNVSLQARGGRTNV